MAQMFPVPPKKKVKKRRKPPIAGPPGRDVLTAGDTADVGKPKANPFAKKGPPVSSKGPKPPLGSGQRFAQLSSQLAKKPGVTNPGAPASVIGRKKFGPAKFNSLAAKGKPGY